MIKESCLYYKKYKDMGATVDWCQNYPHLNFDCEKCTRYIEKNFVQVVRCKDCKHAEHWYRDKGRCFLWHENGIDVFEDGYCNYGERKTMPRLIDANEILKSEHQHYDYMSDEYYVLVRDIENAPTVDISPVTASDFYDDKGHLLNNPPTYKVSNIQAEQNTWFTVEERLPYSDDWMIVTILDESGDTPYRYADFGWYLDIANCWIVDNEQRHDVVAWMPLPKPYKRERKADESN